jgi:hypothetical protein
MKENDEISPRIPLYISFLDDLKIKNSLPPPPPNSTRIFKRLRSPEINSKESIPPAYVGLSYRPARLHRLAEAIPWNRFLGTLNFYKYGLSTLFHVSVVEREGMSGVCSIVYFVLYAYD